MSAPFGSVLIANRGEIAVRIARTLQRLGVRSLLACHSVDRDSPAARAVDQIVELEGDDALAAYLDGDQIARRAGEEGADAVHPGYGFLAENADFAEAVASAGMSFVGPGPEAMRLMGDKIASRAFVAEQGLRVGAAAVQADDAASFPERAAALGFPLLIKASAGGGGKGMQIVRDASQLAPAIERAASEGERFFGDGRLYAERYIERPRHIEVQVLADRHGHCVHLLDRECSIQRRFQKVIEEAPAPSLPDESREAMRSEAVAIARAVGYENAGTVEFIVGPDGEFAFLEMNTRLQVEHPVTECVTGLDLVEQQLLVASGAPLAFEQAAIRASGCAIEMRLCAEIPEQDFAPATGTVRLLRVPEAAGLRFDSGVAEGSRVGATFDPMLAKWIAHGVDREEATRRLRGALEEFVLLGVATNADYVARVLAQPAFERAELHTGFLVEHAGVLAAQSDAALNLLAAAAAALSHGPFVAAAEAVPPLQRAIGAWRN